MKRYRDTYAVIKTERDAGRAEGIAIGEAKGIAIGEALALGKPLIISRNPQIPIDIDAEQCGITIEYGDVEGWKRAIRRIADNPEEAQAMGQRAKQLAERLYNIERCADDVATFLES